MAKQLDHYYQHAPHGGMGVFVSRQLRAAGWKHPKYDAHAEAQPDNASQGSTVSGGERPEQVEAQPKAKPVAWRIRSLEKDAAGTWFYQDKRPHLFTFEDTRCEVQRLYTSPPKVTPDDEAAHDALEVLCRVFDDGADAAFEEWTAWYDPKEWLGPSRALGAFIRKRLER